MPEAVVAICAKEPQLAPLQRSILYPVTPTLSVEALQVSVIWVFEVAVATREPGALGEDGSAGGGGSEFVFEDAEHPKRAIARKEKTSTGKTRSFDVGKPMRKGHSERIFSTSATTTRRTGGRGPTS